jgi:F-type H+-transporting ATPase subunit epsilon
MDQPLPTILDLQVVTPDRRVASERTTMVSLPGKGGRLGILPGHAPLISELASGVLFYEREGQTRYLAVHGGLAEVLPGRVTVLAQAAERGEEINLQRAERAGQHATEQLRQAAESEQAKAALQRSEARIEAAKLAGKG